MRSSTANEIPTRIAADNKVTLTVNKGRTVTEVHQQFNTYASQIVRLREGAIAVELGELRINCYFLQCVVSLEI